MSQVRSLATSVTVITILGLAWVGSAQQSSPAPYPSTAPAQTAPGASSAPTSGAAQQPTTIDCPASAAAPATGSATSTTAPGGPSTGVGTPQGAGTGSGLATMPSVQASQRIDGQITSVGSTRTNRIIAVGDVKLEIEPSTIILVNCKRASTTELKEGSKVKAAYEVKNDNRNLATVVEVQD